MKQFILFLIGTPLFVLMDFIWIGNIANSFYMSVLRPWLNIVDGKPVFNIPFALLTWLVIVLGVVLFPLPKADSVLTALIWGGLFGFVLYGTYDLTNFSTLKNWPLNYTLIDMAWGTFACAMCTTVLFIIQRRFF